MENISWDFPLLGSGNEQGYTNSGIETFKGIEIMDNLAREICQNSLDAKDDSIDAPVIVEFKIISLKKSEYSVFSDLEKCIEGCKKYWADTMNDKLRTFLHKVVGVKTFLIV